MIWFLLMVKTNFVNELIVDLYLNYINKSLFNHELIKKYSYVFHKDQVNEDHIVLIIKLNLVLQIIHK